jgi:hypothetical protein
VAVDDEDAVSDERSGMDYVPEQDLRRRRRASRLRTWMRCSATSSVFDPAANDWYRCHRCRRRATASS